MSSGFWFLLSGLSGGGPVASNPPTAPTLLSPVALAHNLVGLYWTNGANQTGHQIHRSTAALFTAGPATLVKTLVGGDDESYSDVRLTPETTYYYQVLATNSLGDAASNEVSVETPAAPIMAAVNHNLLVRLRRR